MTSKKRTLIALVAALVGIGAGLSVVSGSANASVAQPDSTTPTTQVLPTTAPTTTVLGPAPSVPAKDGWGVGYTPLPGSLILDLDEQSESKSGPGPWVALTFDDGPSQYTDDVVRILQDADVPATFFFLSQNVLARPEDARAVKAAGFHVAAHTIDHKDLATLSYEQAFEEINQSVDDINKTVGPGTVKCLRPPYGSYNDAVLQIAADRGIGVVNWDIDTNDWKRAGAGAIAQKALGAHQASIILMHDGGGPREQTLAALPGIISELKARNYTFVAIC